MSFEITIPAGSVMPFTAEGRYLTIFSSSHEFSIYANGIAEFSIAGLELIELGNVRDLMIKNPDKANPLTVKYRVADLKTIVLADAMVLAEGSQVALSAPVEIAPGQEVTVNGLTIPESVTFTAPVPIKPDAGVAGLVPVVIGATGTDTIAASAARSGLLLVADAANTAEIWIGSAVTGQGVPLKPDDSLPLHTDGAVVISGAESDTVYILETLK